MLRLGAIAIVLLPLALGTTLRDLVWGPWLGVGLAILGGLVLAIARPQARSLILLGTMLAVLAGLSAPQLALPTTQSPSVVDLRHDPPPADLRGPVQLTGYFRNEWILAEYAVPEGALPDQDETAIAQLVPFLGVEDGAAPLGDTVLIVRVRPGEEQAKGVQTVHGRARALEAELLATFVQASGLRVPDGIQGVLVDTLDPTDATPPWLRASLASLAILAAFACLWIATRAVPADEVKPG